jgi:hypothetical protein
VHSHDAWSPGDTAAFSAGIVVAGIVIVGALLLVRSLVKKRSAARTPCPGCGTFLGSGDECPVCPRGRGDPDEGGEASP